MADGGERVLLVHPGIYEDQDPKAFAPWGALAVGSVLLGQGHEVEVADLNGDPIIETMGAMIDEFQPTIVGLTTKLGLAAKRYREAVDYINQRDDNITVVAGGPLVGTYPNIDHPLWKGVDAVFWGDGEKTIANWIASSERPREVVGPDNSADLDANDMGRWWSKLKDYVWDKEYWPGMNTSSMHVASARGCTRRCTFCYLNTQYPSARFRFMSADPLYEQLGELNEEVGASGFYFVDDCFIDQKGERANRFADLNIADGSPFRYGCDVQVVDLERRQELLNKMHDAGFRNLYIGVEAASVAIRKSLGKGSTEKSVKELVERTLDKGYLIRASIGIGWPGETVEDMKSTLKMIDDTPGLAFDAFKFYPLQGTPLGEKAYWRERRAQNQSEEDALREAYSDYSVYNTNYSDVSDADLEAMWQEMRVREADRLGQYLKGFTGS